MVNRVLLSHVCLLVPSVDKAAETFAALGLEVQPPTMWEGEGTKEIYIGDYTESVALPLLVEPFREGAYSRALAKRGPGFHHIAIDVLNLEEFVTSLNGSGWFLHTNSLKTARESSTVYLARSGMPTMIEVQQKDTLADDPAIIESIHLDIDESQGQMMRALGLTQVHAATEASITIAKKKIYFKELI